MFEYFTDQARRVMVLAQEEARRMSHNYVGTEHILLGIMHDGEGVAARVLSFFDLTLKEVRGSVVNLVGVGDSAPSRHMQFNLPAKRVMEMALREVLRKGDTYVGTEHLLLELLREDMDVAVQALLGLDADLEGLRQAVFDRFAIGADASVQSHPSQIEHRPHS